MDTMIFTSAAQSKLYITILLSSLFIAASIFGFRVRLRLLHRSALDVSDYQIFIALLLDIGLTVILTISYARAPADAIWEQVDYADYVSKLLFACHIIWIVAVTNVRSSILTLIVRIFPGRLYRIICWIIFGLNIAAFAVILTIGLICRSFSLGLKFNLGLESISDSETDLLGLTPPMGSHCGIREPLELFTAVMDVLLNSMAFSLSLQIPWKLRREGKKKTQLSMITGSGLVSVYPPLQRSLPGHR